MPKKRSAANINYCGYVTVPYISLTIKMPFLCAETPPGLWIHGIFFISLPILQQHLSPVPVMFLYWSHPKNSGFKAPGSCQARSNRHQEENPPSTCRLALGQISAVRLFNTCVRQYRNSLAMCSAAQEYKKKPKKKLKKNRWKRWNCYPCTISTGWEMERAREEWKKKGRKLLCMEHQWQLTFPAGMGQCRFHHSQLLCREQLLEWEMPKLSLKCHQRDERDSAPSLMIEHPHLPLCWTQWWLKWKMSYYWPDEAADTGWSHPPTIKHLSCHGRL